MSKIINYKNINFDRIAASAANARNNVFLDSSKINKDYWGDTEELTI